MSKNILTIQNKIKKIEQGDFIPRSKNTILVLKRVLNIHIHGDLPTNYAVIIFPKNAKCRKKIYNILQGVKVNDLDLLNKIENLAFGNRDN